MAEKKSIEVAITPETEKLIVEIILDNCEEVGRGVAESVAQQIIETLEASSAA